jgi:hypothetical protein
MMSVVTSFPICCSHPTVPHTSALYWNAGLDELTHVKLAVCQSGFFACAVHPSGELPKCASEELLSNTYSFGNACKAQLVSPSHNSCSVRDQSRMGAHSPTIPALVSPDGGSFLEFVQAAEYERYGFAVPSHTQQVAALAIEPAVYRSLSLACQYIRPVECWDVGGFDVPQPFWRGVAI